MENKEELEAALEKAVNKQNFMAVVSVFTGLSYAERRKLNPTAKALRKKARELGATTFDWQREQRAAIAIMATSTASEVVKRRELLAFPNLFESPNSISDGAAPALYRFITEHEPDWVGAFVDNALDRAEWGTGTWRFAYQMVKEGRCEKPANPNFAAQCFLGMRPFFKQKRTVWNWFDSDPAFLGPLVIEGFSILDSDSAGTDAMGINDPVDENQWLWVIERAIEENYLDQEAVVRACLEGLVVTQANARAKWTRELLDRLIVDPAEHQDAIFGYLSSTISSTVGWALKKLGQIEKAGDLELSGFLEMLPLVLTSSTKSTVFAAIRLTKRAVKDHPKHHAAACESVTEALLFDNSEVHLAVLAFLESYGNRDDEALRERVSEYASALSPATRESFGPWISEAELAFIQLSESEEESAPAAITPVLDPSRELRSISGFDDFVSRLSIALEKGCRIEAGELGLLFAGFGEFNRTRPDDFETRCGPLMKLVRREHGDMMFGGGHVDQIMRRLIKKSLGKVESNIRTETSGLFGRIKNLFQKSDSEEVGDIQEGGTEDVQIKKWNAVAPGLAIMRRMRWTSATPLPLHQYYSAIRYLVDRDEDFSLLSAPTHEDGWIDPSVLVRRVAEWPRDRKIVEIDFCVALLRIAPENRDNALMEARKLSGPVAAVLRYALGDVREVLDGVPTHGAFFLAAGRARSPRKVCEISSLPGPDGQQPAVYELVTTPRTQRPSRWNKEVMEHVPAKVRWSVSPETPKGVNTLPVTLHGDDDPWMASLWPANTDACLAKAAKTFNHSQDSNPGNWAEELLGEYLDVLGIGIEVLSQVAETTLLLGLNSGSATIRARAEDLLIRVIDEGRIDNNHMKMGEAVGKLIEAEYLKLNRVLPIFQTVAAVSSRHARLITRIAFEGVSFDPMREKMPNRFGVYLEFLNDQARAYPEEAILPAKGIAYLESMPPKSKAGRLATGLLCVGGG